MAHGAGARGHLYSNTVSDNLDYAIGSGCQAQVLVEDVGSKRRVPPHFSAIAAKLQEDLACFELLQVIRGGVASWLACLGIVESRN
ncbi:MAG TPA: hypothetical protein VIV60_34680 [Polyangiaceae bacterium]